MNKNYDFVVIGGGSAGYAAAETAAREGLTVAVGEGGRKVGGQCILTGCMPSKAVIESANRFTTLRRAAEFGLRAGNISARGDEIIARKKELIAGFSDHRRGQLELGPFDFIRGTAGFVDAHTVEITSAENSTMRITGRAFLISTGSTEHLVDIPGLAETGYLDSDAILESPDIPASVIVLGGGPVAIEFAHYYAAFGAQVVILQRSEHVLKEMDADVAEVVESAFRKRGMQVELKAAILRVERHEEKKRVWFQQSGEEKSVEAEEIVYALGRVPQLSGLHPERAGLAVERGRLVCDTRQQTSVPHIFAAGDVAGPHAVVHLAVEQGEIAARNAARLLRAKSEPLEEIDFRLKLSVVFSEPQVASAGFTEKELMQNNVPYAVAKYSFEDLGKSIVIAETEGFVKLLANEKSREIIGAAAAGPHASELIHEIVVAMYFRASARDLARIPHYHPTLSEIWTYPAAELDKG